MVDSEAVRTSGTLLYQYDLPENTRSRVLLGVPIRYSVFGSVRQAAQRESLRDLVPLFDT